MHVGGLLCFYFLFLIINISPFRCQWAGKLFIKKFSLSRPNFLKLHASEPAWRPDLNFNSGSPIVHKWKMRWLYSDFPGVGQATSLPGGFSDDEGLQCGGGARGSGAGEAPAGRHSPTARSYRLCRHEGQGTLHLVFRANQTNISSFSFKCSLRFRTASISAVTFLVVYVHIITNLLFNVPFIARYMYTNFTTYKNKIIRMSLYANM